ncbi:hypothetical protein [Nitrosomonas europaea]|uniref:hypothetical protein n=1 Tax=Nitrosomonas europaea TaxID=915 RepID=UPI000794446C|nr:hypothetical protein [Nitrosomonas europaea]KXK44079.1 MAG: Helix-turn-helix domain protein [Nitrosomonas europaea]
MHIQISYFTVQDVANFHGITPQRVRRLLSEGRIKGFKDSHNIWCITSLDIRPPRKSGFHRFRLKFRKGDGNA